MNDTTKGAHGSNNMECPVCLGRLSAPKVLPCGHSFCETCLEPLIRTERDQRLVSCPECRETANVPEDGFPTNYTLEGKNMGSKCRSHYNLEALRHLRDDERTKKCKGCEKGFSDAEVMRCLTCEKDFCERVRTPILLCARLSTVRYTPYRTRPAVLYCPPYRIRTAEQDAENGTDRTSAFAFSARNHVASYCTSTLRHGTRAGPVPSEP